MEDNKQRSFTIPLVELVIVVGIFAIVSVILMKMYLSADKLRGSAVTISEQTLLAENDIELLKAKLDDLSFEDAVASLGYETKDGVYTKVVPAKTEEQNGEYVLKLYDTEESYQGGELHEITVEVGYDEDLRSISTKMYVAGN